MKLASQAQVLKAMGVVENPGSALNVTPSLEMAYDILENLLETVFEERTTTDYFDATAGRLSLRLTHSFVFAETVKVRVSTSSDQLRTPTDGELLASSSYMLDVEKGVLTMRDRFKASPSAISITYDSGLVLDDDDQEMRVGPQWLRDAAIAMAIHAQSIVPSSPANRKGSAIVNISRELRAYASGIVNGHLRPRMSVAYPIGSESNA